MLDLSPTSAALDALRTRYVERCLPAGLGAEAFAAFDLHAYSARELWLGRRAWAARALDEYRSQVAFTELLADLTEARMGFDILGLCIRVVSDEMLHVELCRRLLCALGGSDKVPGEPRWVRQDAKHPVRVRILKTVVGSLCIGETLSVRTLAAVRDHAADPLAKGVLTQLVRDEAIHGRFGWHVLDALLPSLTPSDLRGLNALIPRWLSSAERTMLPPGTPVAPSDRLTAGPAMPFGSLGPEDRAEVFHDALERDVCARFRERGFSGQASWQPRRASAA
jgi:hypothetical protein